MNRAILAVAALAIACSDSHESTPAPPAQDRTPPTVLARYPLPGDANGLASGPYRVVFSEALDRESFGADAVRVWQATGRVPATPVLSSDGKTIWIMPDVAPAIPGWVLVELSPSLKDLAGNAIALPQTSWWFDLPVWVKPGGPGPISPADGPNPHPSLALDADDQPVVGMANLFPEFATRYDGGRWVALPNPPSATIHMWITTDTAGQIWHADVGYVGETQVNRFDGATWSRLGALLPETNPSAYPWDARLVVREGAPVVSWVEYLPPEAGGPATSFHVRGWSGTAWMPWVDDAGPVDHPRIALGATGAIVASWNERFNARAGWVSPFGLQRTASPPAASPIHGTTAVAAGLHGNPVVAFGEDASGTTAIRVKEWTGSAWRQLGPDVSVAPLSFTTPAIVTRTDDGLPVVAWTEGQYQSSRKLYVARFDGALWQRLGPALNVDLNHDVYEVALALDRYGAPVLAWAEATGETRSDSQGHPYAVYQFQVKRLNR